VLPPARELDGQWQRTPKSLSHYEFADMVNISRLIATVCSLLTYFHVEFVGWDESGQCCSWNVCVLRMFSMYSTDDIKMRKTVISLAAAGVLVTAVPAIAKDMGER
jgi:hypothetical protein